VPESFIIIHCARYGPAEFEPEYRWPKELWGGRMVPRIWVLDFSKVAHNMCSGHHMSMPTIGRNQKASAYAAHRSIALRSHDGQDQFLKLQALVGAPPLPGFR
jgi:hypothetical protein